MTSLGADAAFCRHGCRLPAIIAATACWAVFIGMAMWVSDGSSSRFDAEGLAIFRTGPDFGLIGPVWMEEAVRDVTALGGVFLRNLFSVIIVTALLTLGFQREAAALFVTVAGGWAAGVALKVYVMRPRPDILPHLMDAGGFSFPSGHTFNATVVYLSIGLTAARLTRNLSVQYAVVSFSLTLSILVGLTRIMLGVHFPTDVIAGLAGGAGWTFLCMALFWPAHHDQQTNRATSH